MFNNKPAWSAPLDSRFYSESPALRRLSLELTKDICTYTIPYGYRVKDNGKLVDAVKLLSVNFLRVRCCGVGHLAIPLRNGDKFYRLGSIKYVAMRQAWEGLKECGYIEIASKHYFGPEKKLNRRTRFRATEKLIEKFDEYELGPGDIETSERPRLVILRDRKDGSADLQAGPVRHWPQANKDIRQSATKNLRKINAALADACIALHVPDKVLEEIQINHARSDQGKYVDFFNRDLYRVYNETPHKGGRFYGGFWINIPSRYRKHIHISATGKHPAPVVELDYSAVQPRLLYAEIPGCAQPKDPYCIFGRPDYDKEFRPLIKTFFLQMLNCRSKTSAIKAANRAIRDEFNDDWRQERPAFPAPKMTVQEMLEHRYWAGCPSVQQLMKLIEEANAPIAHSFYKGVGLELMNKDAQLAEQVMLRVIEDLGTVALPIHDSFLIRYDLEHALWNIMDEEAKNLFGARFQIKPPDAKEYDIKRELHEAMPDAREDDDPGIVSELISGFENEKIEYSRYFALVDAWIAGLSAEVQDRMHVAVDLTTNSYRRYRVGRRKHYHLTGQITAEPSARPLRNRQ